MQQSATPQLQAQSEARRKPAVWQVWLPVLGFCLWLVYKQRLALHATGIPPGPVMWVASLGIVLALTPWVFLREGRSRWVWALVLNLLLTLLVFADIVYFRQFGDLVSVASLRFARQLGTVGSSVTALLRPGDLWLWADVPVLLAFIAVPRLQPENWLGRLPGVRLKGRTAGLLALAGAIVLTLVAIYDPLLKAKYYGHSMVASRMGLLNYHLFDVGNYTGRLAAKLLPNGEAVAAVNGYFGDRRADQAQLPPSPLAGAAKGKNVIVLQLESYQAFVLGMKVDGQEITPNLNRLAGESLQFTDFYTQTGQGVTSDADFLANCSLYPTRTGAVYYDYAHNDFRCMPDLLREQGYKAVAMQGMPPDFWNLAAVYPQVGFEQYYSSHDFDMTDKVGIGLSDESFLRQSVAKLKALPEPYYAFLVTLTSHGPFDETDAPRTLKLGELEGTEAGNYLHAAHYTDKAVGQFVDQLKTEGILDDAVLVVYGDHAGIFRGNSGMSEVLQIPAADEVAQTRMEKRIPMMIRLPNGAGAGERTLAGGQVDIAPTLAGLLGLPTDSAWFMGRDLLREPEGVVAFYTGSAMTDEYLYWAKEGGPGACYARATGAQVAVETCDPVADAAATALRTGRLIVERDLVPELMEAK